MAMPSSGWCAGSIAAAAITVGACGLDWTVREETSGDSGSGAGHDAGNGGTTTSQSATTVSAGGMGGSAATGQEGGDGGATASASTASSSSSGPQPMCDQQPNCEDCDTCAVNGPCAQYYNNCQADQWCAYLEACVYNNCVSLGDVGCIDACYYEFPEGAQLFDMMVGCAVCDVCQDTCVGFQVLWNC